VTAGNGVDIVDDRHGKIVGLISLGGDDDVFKGGSKAEHVADGDDDDTINLGGGNDVYIATGNSGADGVDTVNGGRGIDLYDASAATLGIDINLDKVSHIFPALSATGVNASGSIGVFDSIINFENVTGGSGADVIIGSSKANVIDGGGNADTIIGLGGRDILTGGSGGDTFRFVSIKDSGTTAATRDFITDFTSADVIDLSGIDANTKVAGDQAFTFLGTNVAFDGVAGRLVAHFSTAGQIIEGDVNGDKKADFSIEFSDPTHVYVLSGVNGVDLLL
jgi:Ca2+-binding RTX toxin-like protein